MFGRFNITKKVKNLSNATRSELDYDVLLYNYRQINGSKEEFEKSTLGEICDEILTWIEINSKKDVKASKNKESNKSKSVKFSYGKSPELN